MNSKLFVIFGMLIILIAVSGCVTEAWEQGVDVIPRYEEKTLTGVDYFTDIFDLSVCEDEFAIKFPNDVSRLVDCEITYVNTLEFTIDCICNVRKGL